MTNTNNTNPGGFNIGDVVTNKIPAAEWGAYGHVENVVAGFAGGMVMIDDCTEPFSPNDLVPYKEETHGVEAMKAKLGL